MKKSLKQMAMEEKAMALSKTPKELSLKMYKNKKYDVIKLSLWEHKNNITGKNFYIVRHETKNGWFDDWYFDDFKEANKRYLKPTQKNIETYIDGLIEMQKEVRQKNNIEEEVDLYEPSDQNCPECNSDNIQVIEKWPTQSETLQIFDVSCNVCQWNTNLKVPSIEDFPIEEQVKYYDKKMEMEIEM